MNSLEDIHILISGTCMLPVPFWRLQERILFFAVPASRGSSHSLTHSPSSLQNQVCCIPPNILWASLISQLVKNLPVMEETGVQSLGWEDAPGGRKWQPSPVFLPGESHGQRSLAGYSPWSRKSQT